jgi:hypothetical protein
MVPANRKRITQPLYLRGRGKMRQANERKGAKQREKHGRCKERPCWDEFSSTLAADSGWADPALDAAPGDPASARLETTCASSSRSVEPNDSHVHASRYRLRSRARVHVRYSFEMNTKASRVFRFGVQAERFHTLGKL